MQKIAELPLVEPMYSTYHNGIASAVLTNNLSIRNWYLNEVISLECDRRFLNGYTTPNIGVAGSAIANNPYIERVYIPMTFLKGCLNQIIRNLIDDGYYVYFLGIDDYYVPGKSWYKERHFRHDGTICGYNQIDKTYCIYAYDTNWIYQKFWTPQKCFNKGLEMVFKKDTYGNICAIKPKLVEVCFSADTALKGIVKYLDSDMEKYPEDEQGHVFGIIVQEYIAKYVGKLLDGSIPYERMDRRVFRMIWEHKKVMLERIKMIEESLDLGNEISELYKTLVAEANTIRMLYASHHMKRRDSVLPVIQKKLIQLMQDERKLLEQLLDKTERKSENESVEAAEK